MSLGPWSARPPSPPRRRRGPVWLVLAIGLLLALGVVGLSRLSLGRPLTGDDWAYVGLRLLMLALALSALMAQGLRMRTAIRHATIWFGVAAVLFLGFTFRDELGFAAARIGSELAPGAAMQTQPGELVIARDMDGAFYVMGSVNGTPVRFLVDTGASDTVLSPADAQRLGLDLADLDFSRTYQTANGVGRGAAFVADSLTVGSLRHTDMPMAVNQAAMSSSLLGMSFFTHLESVEIRGDKLYLRWRS